MTLVTDQLAIVVSGLRKNYDDFEVVRDISFDLARGQVLCLLGPNGAGKSTTIEVLEGLRHRTAGEVRVLGHDPDKRPLDLRRRVGLVLQDTKLDPYLTVAETITMFAGVHAKPLPVDEVIALVGLEKKRGTLLGSLSGGQLRRVDVGVGIVGDPDLIFLDEPTTGFDPTARRAAWSMLDNLKETGKTILLTTHYMDEAEYLADKIMIISDGKIVASGSATELRGQLGQGAKIEFTSSVDIDPDTLGSQLGLNVYVNYGRLKMSVSHTQTVLDQLLQWAKRESIELQDLTVNQPTLEDVYLELIKSQG